MVLSFYEGKYDQPESADTGPKPNGFPLSTEKTATASKNLRDAPAADREPVAKWVNVRAPLVECKSD
jgi:hypothetical protein